MFLKEKLSIAISILFLFSSVSYSQTIEKVILTEPSNGQITSSKPVFKIIVQGDNSNPAIKYKIELSRDNFKTVYKTFEQLNDRKGWTFHELYNEQNTEVTEKGAFFRTPEALSDGLYQWRASAYDGMTYHDGVGTSSFIVDSTPPAEVTKLRLEFDQKTGFTRLRWDPVFTDSNGGSEYIDHYNVYRYEKRSFFFVIRPFFIGSSVTESFLDKDIKKNIEGKVLYYKVVAVDKAGNELGRRF